MKIITLDDTQLGIIADGLLLLKGNESYNMEQCQEILDAIMPDCSDSMVNQTKPYDDIDEFESANDRERDSMVNQTKPYDDGMDGDFDSGMASAGMGTDEQYEHNLYDNPPEWD